MNKLRVGRPCIVPQTSSLLCRGFPIRKVWGGAKVSGLSKALPTGSRRYSRLETCATPCAADFQSAVSRISNPQGLGGRRFRACPRPCRLEVGDTRLPGGGQAAGWKPAARLVPQTSSLLCRGFPIRKVWGGEGFGLVQGPADWKSAIQQVGNLRHACPVPQPLASVHVCIPSHSLLSNVAPM